MADDHYTTLGLSRTATSADIQKAYRDMARKYHPDLHPDDKTAKKKFQEVTAAFEVLNDPKKREMYDRYGAGFEQMAGGGGRGPNAGPPPGWGGGPNAGGAYENIDLSDILGGYGGEEGPGAGVFGDLFGQFRRGGPSGKGQSKRSAPSRRGQDVATELEVSFKTAIVGGTQTISLQRSSGQTETLNVKIPAGIESGKRIRLRGQGEAGLRGENGDLLITVHVAPHPSFTRRGANLEVVVPVTLAEAVIGAKVDVPTPKGVITLRVPPGSSSGRKLRVRGHGVAPAKGEPGDLYAEIQIVLPPDMTDEDREMIRLLDERLRAGQPDPRRDLQW